MVRDELSVLSAFLAVAEERSFTRAAKRIGVTQSALSHAIRGLEEQIGVRLLARTTRSVAPTEAGEELLAHLRPALGDIRGALDHLSALRDRPAGREERKGGPAPLEYRRAPAADEPAALRQLPSVRRSGSSERAVGRRFALPGHELRG